MGSPTSTPLRTAFRRPGLALLLWAWYTGLSMVVVLPTLGWLAGVTGTAPETDVLLDGIQLGALIELLQVSDGLFSLLFAVVVALVGLALLSNAFLSGGVLAVVLQPATPGRLPATFFHGAGRFFLRSLGLLLVTYVLFVAVCGAAMAVLAPGLDWLLEPAGEPGSLAWGVIVVMVACAIAGLFQIGLDYSRVLLVRDDARGVFGTWLRGAVFVLRRPIASLTPCLPYGLAILATVVLGAWLGASVSARSWFWILLATLGQQALLLLTVSLRVAMVSAEAGTVRRCQPPTPEPELVVEPAAEPKVVTEALPHV